MAAAGIITLIGQGLSLIGNIWGSAKQKKASGADTATAIQSTLSQYGSNYSPYGLGGSTGGGISVVSTPQGLGVSTSIDFSSILVYGGIIALIVYLFKR